MAELVDARDSKSRSGNRVSVRFRPGAPFPSFGNAIGSIMMKTIFSLLFILILVSNAEAYEKKEINLPSGTDLIYTGFEEGNSTLIIWLPSEHGTSPEMIESALNIAVEGFDVWTLDLHSTYMEPPGRASMAKFDAEEIYQILAVAKKRGYENIVLSAASRGAILALNAGRMWQIKHPGDHNFLGYIFLHPHLIEGSVEIGDDAAYLPIARAVNKPVFILQPEYSTKFLRSDQVARQLKTGGAELKLVAMDNIAAGFYARPREDLTDADLAMRSQMGTLFDQGFEFLKAAKQPDKAAPMAGEETAQTVQKSRVRSLTPFKGSPAAPALKLKGIDGKTYDLSSFKGQVVLVNFWATWCGPCVKEIPSLNRLVEKMQGTNFQLLSVDIKEHKRRIKSFFDRLELKQGFPVLMDRDGKASKAWKVYAYPSTFLIDKAGTIRYAKRGAMEWDDQDVIDTITALF